MQLLRTLSVLALCLACVLAVPPPDDKLEQVLEKLNEVKEELNKEMEVLDEVLNEAEEAPEEREEEEDVRIYGREIVNIKNSEGREASQVREARHSSHSYTCGGNSGRSSWNDKDYVRFGPITGFKLWHDWLNCFIEGIQVRYGTQWAPAHNDRLKADVEVDFQYDEYIIGVDMDKKNYLFNDVVCKLTIHTNKRVYGPYCNSRNCNKDRCPVLDQNKWGHFGYISGRHSGGVDRTLDSLTFHEWFGYDKK